MLGLPGSVVAQYHPDTIEALITDLGPDVVIAVPPQATTVRAAVPPAVEQPVLSPSRSRLPDAVATADGDILVTTIPEGADSLTATAIRDEHGVDVPDDATGSEAESHRVCLTGRVSLAVDPYRRSTAIEGLDAYHAQLPEGWSGGASTHCSTALRAGYRTTTSIEGASCSLVGIGQSEASLGVGAADQDRLTASLVGVYRNGAVGVERIDPVSFGLRSISGVGAARAETLRRAGYQSPADVVDAPVQDLAGLSGFGRTTASTVQAAAQARTNDVVVATGDDSLPYGEPVFIDIETDGLEPSCAWLIGVLDGDAENGHYMAFTESHPGDSDHIDAFLTWMQANADGRPLVAWNGYSFDFPVLADQIQKHCPQHVDAFEDTYQFDLLWWARTKNGGNAALPGRNNTLEPVAEALNWTPQTTGIDGATVARVYSAYRRRYLAAEAARDVAEPDWERLKRYCEDDVRALATIYDALADAARREPGTSSERTDSGTQGALSDFT